MLYSEDSYVVGNIFYADTKGTNTYNAVRGVRCLFENNSIYNFPQGIYDYGDAGNPSCIARNNRFVNVDTPYVGTFKKIEGADPAITTVTVGASPFSWQNTTQYDVMVYLSGGDPTVEISADGTTFYDLGTLRQIRVPQGWYIRITYTTAPTMFYVNL